MVEYDLPALKGLVVNNSEFISGAVAATVRAVVAGEDDKWITLPVLSANPASVAAFTAVVSALSACGLPVRITSSVKDLSAS